MTTSLENYWFKVDGEFILYINGKQFAGYGGGSEINGLTAEEEIMLDSLAYDLRNEGINMTISKIKQDIITAYASSKQSEKGVMNWPSEQVTSKDVRKQIFELIKGCLLEKIV